MITIAPNTHDATPSPLRGGPGWGESAAWRNPSDTTLAETSPHPNPPLKGEGTHPARVMPGDSTP